MSQSLWREALKMNKIYAVGIGPGNREMMTFQAVETLKRCTAVAGYKLYLEQVAFLTEGKKLIPGGMRQEIQRCREAMEAALAGETVAVISSGDAGVYGMAGLLMELAQEERYSGIEVEVVPGITAASSCAALVGAPFMNDFAVVSLSDLMTDAALIRKRLAALASVDLPVAIYNPASTKRQELLSFAVETFRKAGGNLPCAIIRDAYRPSQQIHFCTLDAFPHELIQMTTLVIIGNSKTVWNGRHFFNPRGYREKYGVGE